jgi:hypothetical protein
MRAVGSASAPVVALGAPGFESAGSMGEVRKMPGVRCRNPSRARGEPVQAEEL